MPKNRHILVLEDEQRAGEKLIDLIRAFQPHVKLEWCRSVVEGTAYIKENSTIDLIFSDIELLDGNAFGIFDAVTPKCPIIFCTAYDRFYVQAFQTNGIAYLLKPYSKHQFKEAWEKYERLFEAEEKQPISADLLASIQALVGNNSKEYKRMFSVKKRDGVFLLKIEDVAYFQAQGDFVFAFDKKNTRHVLNQSLSSIEDHIDARQFFRINRSEIVNIDCIEKFSNYTKNRLVINLLGTTDVLYTTNSRTPEFRRWIEGQ